MFTEGLTFFRKYDIILISARYLLYIKRKESAYEYSRFCSTPGDPPQNVVSDAPKKQIPLRLSSALYEELAVWAQEDFRSVNGQIEYLLTQCLRYHRKNGSSDPETPSSDS